LTEDALVAKGDENEHWGSESACVLREVRSEHVQAEHEENRHEKQRNDYWWNCEASNKHISII
jgi:hypothetical protein